MTIIRDAAAIDFEIRRKSAGVAYVLWFFLGYVGAHRFYLGRQASGAAMAGALILGIIFTLATLSQLQSAVDAVVLFLPVYLFWLLPISLWHLLDVALVPGMVQSYNSDLADELMHTSRSPRPVSYAMRREPTF